MENASALVDMSRSGQALERGSEGLKRSAQAKADRAQSPLAARKSATSAQESATRPIGLRGTIRDNLIARIAEAETEGWLGEVEDLRVSLAGAEEKLRQFDRSHGQHTVVGLGIPTTRRNR
ncbi:hypothetical protein [Streptomyces chattanoogensis]|uniref:hypothetical protein n=1 Tax=Streptomyces chattanoogensis TaxID=66876 RepID=UPI0036BC5293